VKVGKLHIKDTWIWLIVSILIIGSVSFSGINRKFTTFKKVDILVLDKENYQFINEENLESNLVKYLPPFGSPVSKVNKKYIQDLVNNHPAVESSSIYISLSGEMQIDIIQKKPIIRIIDELGKNFYIDAEGKLFPVFPGSAARVAIANGSIKLNSGLKEVVQNKSTIEDIKKNSPTVYKTFVIVKAINENDFLRNLTEQIYLNSNGDFEIIPKVGDFRIILGSEENLEPKFKKLLAMYKTGLKYAGWNRYSIINLKFDSQVVCTLKR